MTDYEKCREKRIAENKLKMQEMGICSAAYETQSKKGTKRKCRSKEDDIENDEMERDDDAEYDPEMEDKGEMEEDKSEMEEDKGEMEEDKGEMEEDKGEEETDTTTRTASEIVSHNPKKKRGRGPTKGLKNKEPMHLEYDKFGQPCGKWRHMYGQQVGLCMRKLSILTTWKEVTEGMKKALWEDTVNLFHIEPDEAKKEVFLSAVAERFRDFKTKLVSGWITLRRKEPSLRS
ncbi:uncharacterized protein LOC130590023 [Beta vulgaris subsp. vulgaris]|uniref:uncharacterized protein LOC130590023 n=1 Tax=Beta vulgaris subsp. vulgaris TaxID=3555 RepID=UPI0025499359|nr:uncharacterized protein LOC130590023 [Beta vulgaris subsp. vulgaris]